MSGPCGSTKCVCEEACFCPDIDCHCRKYRLLEKICPRCNLPFPVIILKDYKRQVCSCDKQGSDFYSEAQSNLQTAASARSNRSSTSSVGGDQCPRCSLPILIVTEDEDCESSVCVCSCSHKTLSTDNPDMSTEHETSTCTSDHREVSTDRQVRKALSRKTRTEKSTWQAKKIKERSSNSAEESSNTETVDADEILAVYSYPASLEEQNLSSSGISEVLLVDIQNLNSDSNTQSQTGPSSRADDTSTGNVSLLVNTSGISSPYNPKPYSAGESLGFTQSNHNVRPILPNPFPRLPEPIPGPSAFGGQLGQFLNLTVHRPPRAPHPFQSVQPAVVRAVKMDKWFDSLRDVLNTSGELPNAETAAALDKEDKERLKEEPGDNEEEQSENKLEKNLVEQSANSSNSEKVPAYKSPVNAQKNGNDKDDIVPTSDTERSTISKSHKES